MAKASISKATAHKIESAAVRIDEGLRALHELANVDGITADTLSTCCEQMTSAMLVHVRTLYNLADGEDAHHG